MDQLLLNVLTLAPCPIRDAFQKSTILPIKHFHQHNWEHSLLNRARKPRYLRSYDSDPFVTPGIKTNIVSRSFSVAGPTPALTS